MNRLKKLAGLAAVLLLVAGVSAEDVKPRGVNIQPVADTVETGKPSGGGGRLSPASLDLDTCGCPTTFGDPTCEERTSWTVTKESNTDPLFDADGDPFEFTVTVTEGETRQILSGSGEIVVTNSGQQTPSLASVAVLLEDLHEGGGRGDAPGPSGKSWDVLASVFESEFADCQDGDDLDAAVTCYGDVAEQNGVKFVLYDCDNHNDLIALSDRVMVPPATDNDGDGRQGEDPASEDLAADQNCWGIVDNDGDGLIDEDPIDFDESGNPIDNDGDGLFNEDDPDDDGDGLVDEDSDCEDAVRMCFDYEFDITGLGIDEDGDDVVPSDDDLRINLLVTFDATGARGGTCTADLDCEGTEVPSDDVRTVQQRLRFDPVPCAEVCDCVDLADAGATASDTECIYVESSRLDQPICATGQAGTTTTVDVDGTVSCLDESCNANVTNEATLSCEDPSLIEGSPASASFYVECPGGGGGGGGQCDPIEPGDFCSQTQGGWGTDKCNGNNTACLRDNYFGDVFPSGLVVGDSDGPDADDSYAILLTSSTAVADYLPAGGPPAALTADQTDPETTSSGVFGGQLVAATMNVAFDAAGYGKCTLTGDCTFADGSLGDLVYTCGVAEGLAGLTVNEVIALANVAISGGGTPDGVSISHLSDALAALNEEFVDCDTVSTGCLNEGETCEIVWPEGGTLSSAFEDLPICGNNDWDYNDLVVDISTVGVFGNDGVGDLLEMRFSYVQDERIAGYRHEQHFAAGTFGCDGTYDLSRNGVLVADDVAYNDGATNIITIVDSSTNSENNSAELVITFEAPCQFSFPAWDPALVHGENLFYDPYIRVYNTGNLIHTGDDRMLTVPVDWMWPPERQAIWNSVYDCVTQGNGPVSEQGTTSACPARVRPLFVADWWTDNNNNGTCDLP